MEKIVAVFFIVLLTLCVIVLSTCFIVLIIIYLSRYFTFFMKIYLYIFEREDYKIYKEAKTIIKNGGTLPVYTSFIDKEKQKGLYIMVFANDFSLWKDQECCLVNFHQPILNELVKLGNLEETINKTRIEGIEYRKQLEKEIQEFSSEVLKK